MMTANEIINPVSPKFCCLLDDQPSYLVPEHFYHGELGRVVDGSVFINPFAWFSWQGAAPSEIVIQIPLDEAFLGGLKMVWIVDPAIQMLSPFWISDDLARLFDGKRPGDLAPSGLSLRMRQVLIDAGVLVERDYVERRYQKWAEINAYASQGFRHGYVPLGNLIHPYHVGALRQYYRRLISTGHMKLGDGQSNRRYVSHNEPVARFFHEQLTKVVSAIINEPVKPSYVYSASYLAGAKLPRHIDREQCEYSITFLLDTAPEPYHVSPWPIYLDASDVRVLVFQALGESLLYRGHQLAHYRMPLWEGYTSTSIFFHYVPKNFVGSLR